MKKTWIILFFVIVLSACGSSNSTSPNSSVTSTLTPKVSTPTTSVSGKSIIYGIDVNQFDKDIGPSNLFKVLSDIKQAGAKVVRIGVPWSMVQPDPQSYNWLPVDRLFSMTNSLGLTVLFEIGLEPSWDAPNGNTSAPPADCINTTSKCNEVINYVTQLVNHAKSEGLRYLIPRNEPQNFNKNWMGGDASSYAHFQQVVYQAAHRADPNIMILNGGTEMVSPSLEKLAQSLFKPTPYEQQASAFSHALYTNPSWCDSIDILDIHVGDHGPVYSPEIVDSSEAALMACNGNKHIPVWVTEVGYPSLPQLQNNPVFNIELGGKYQQGEVGQANFLADTFKALANDPNVIGINWTFMIDPNITNNIIPNISYRDASSQGISDGLAYSNYQFKQSYYTFKKIATSQH
jgi:hypothetical protein